MQTFRDLVEQANRRGIRGLQRPRSMSRAAEDCGVCRAYLYNLMAGVAAPSDEIIDKLVRGLPAPKNAVTAALRRSRTYAAIDS